MSARPAAGLWLRLALPLLLFVAAGSSLLVVWMHAAARRESRNVFATLARTNADLIHSARLPITERTADYLGRVLSMRVFFHRDAERRLTPAPEGALAAQADRLASLAEKDGIVRVSAGAEAIAVRLGRDAILLLVRDVEPAWAFLLRGEMLPLLGVFGLLSVALAWALARGIVRPLRLLAQRLPQIEHDPEATLPGAARTDEIGQLARAYLATRTQLADERARRAQAEKLALLGRMATGLAHEIYNPLGAIRMHAQLLESTPAHELPAASAEALPVVLGETAKIEGLVQQWMFLARPQPPQTARTELGPLVADAVRALAPQAAHSGVTIANSVPDGLMANVDARRIAQVISNLVINAIHAMPGGGQLTIEGEPTRLTFRDCGRGFSPAALTRHAELFFSEKEGGMGVGLSVAEEIMQAHGGSLHVANCAQGGAIVSLEFPRST